METKLIRIDRNGSKHFEGDVKCDRCGGSGVYAWCVRNGQIIPTIVDNGVCHKCNGKGTVRGKWIERTPEYQAKLDAKRDAKFKEMQAKIDAERKEREEREERIRLEREEQIRKLKSISQYVGEIGDKVTLTVEYITTASFQVKSFRGYGTNTMFIHIFKDSNGNKFVWKTQSGGIDAEYGDVITVKGTIKDHSEYSEEKQTVLTRCRIIRG